MKLPVICALVGLLFGVTTARAQSITSGSVDGRVVTVAGEPIGAAFVYVRDGSGGRTYAAETDSDGRFAFGLLPPGEYVLTAEQLGYRPVTMQGIVVAAGSRARVSVTLVETDPPASSIDSTRFAGRAGAAEPGVARTIPAFGLERLTWNDRMLLETSGLSTLSLGATAHEGLPTPVKLGVDGVVFGVTGHPVLPTTTTLAGAAPTLGFTQATLLTAPQDLEWGGFSGGLLNGVPRRGTADVSVTLFGDWAGSPGASSRNFDPNAGGHSSFRGGGLLQGPIVPDTVQFAIGGEYHRLQTPMPAPWIGTATDSLLIATATDSFTADLGPYIGSRLVQREVATGFARFDAQFERHGLYVWSSFTRVKETQPETGPAGIVGLDTQVEATDITAGLVVGSRLSSVFRNELRAGFARTSRQYDQNGLPATSVGGLGVRFGTDAGQPGNFARTHVTVSDALHLGLGVFQVKLGGAVAFAAHDLDYAYGQVGQYVFSDPDFFGRTEGSLVLATGTPTPARWSGQHFSGFLQTMWSATPQIDLLLGMRWDGERMPVGKIVPDAEWLRLTGLRNDSIQSFRSKFSPRFGFRWRQGANDDWIVQGTAGVYYDEVNPAVLAELIAESGRISVRRGVGVLGSWLDPANTLPGQEVGKRLTLLGPDFEAARSSKFSLGIGRSLGTGGVLELSANYRHTDFLPRRVDLNLLSGRTAQDQDGRWIYGSLAKSGSVLGPAPGSNRRFGGYEMVSAFNADGQSDYWGLTARLDVAAARFVNLLASYTYSQTTDNWLTGRNAGPYEQLNPFPGGEAGGDWTQGRSDYDVPHRATVGVEVVPLGRGGFSIAALYRYQSGLPFTPGYPYGTDMNGDGAAGNDPAFVDNAIAGVDLLVAEWDCLRDQVGRFAQRNACRDPSLSSLDLRAGLGPVFLFEYPIELWIEFLNITETNVAIRDHALYLVDSATPLTTDPVTGDVTIPVVANPNFGEPIAYRGAGRAIRFGLRVNY